MAVREDLIASAVSRGRDRAARPACLPASPPQPANASANGCPRCNVSICHAIDARVRPSRDRHTPAADHADSLRANDAVLHDPSVASASLDKKVAFLQSKNMTPEEIEVALARAGGEGDAIAVAELQQQQQQQQQGAPPGAPFQSARGSAGYGYGYGFAQQPMHPPELPQRDWRDWFVMATTVAGVGYGVYSLGKRYIAPLIAPPTPAQLEADKADVDEQFSRAFALIDQLTADTAALKTAEEARTEKLDTTLRDVEAVTADLRLSSRRRDEDIRRISDEIRMLKDGIPKAIEGERKGYERRLTELGTELKSLKVLLSNRLSAPAPAPQAPAPITIPAATATPTAAAVAASGNPNAGGQMPMANGGGSATSPAMRQQTASPTPGGAAPQAGDGSRPASTLGKPASIPAWQRAAASKARSPTGSPEAGSPSSS
ncbi:peroxisomal membrane protein pex14 [Ascosphaera acerosa]|nr:peroxisomal membrane protein pex14 [Ascosphaera acerosa]